MLTAVCWPGPAFLSVLRLLQDDEGNKIAGPEFSAELAAELDQYGAAVGAPGQWASCVRIVDPAGETRRPGMVVSCGLMHSRVVNSGGCVCELHVCEGEGRGGGVGGYGQACKHGA